MPLFERMGQLLEAKGHSLRVVCGSPPAYELSKGDNLLGDGRYWQVVNSCWLLRDKIHFYRSHAPRGNAVTDAPASSLELLVRFLEQDGFCNQCH